MCGRASLVLGLLLLATSGKDVGAGQLPGPSFDLVKPEAGYRGVVGEDGLGVEFHPPIRASPNVCSFSIVSHHSSSDTPFIIRLRDAAAGTAEVVASRPLDCERRRNYRFEIAATGCDGGVSGNVTVHVKVADVNEFPPVFPTAAVAVAADEGRLYEELVVLQATDEDCSPKYGDVCGYELLSRDQPFTVSAEGVVSNTAPLDHEASPEHVLSVVAHDCGMRRSEPVVVTVKVNRVCHLGWKGIPQEVQYWGGSGRQELFPQASLALCGAPCEVQEVHTRVTLDTQHIGRGCDRDAAPPATLRKMCGASTDAVDLLPSPGPAHPWTAGLHSDDLPTPPAVGGGEGAGSTSPPGGGEGEVVYEFEGEGVVIPRGVLSHATFSSTFSISTWMKHSPPHDGDKHLKEHVLCVADDAQMNRHHVALFVRHCRLILLLRHEPQSGALNAFQPAEWRWNLPQVCDDAWHHYSVQVKLPEVALFVDGHPLHPEGGEPEVLDDWPLHPTKGINTTLSVGACWQGSEQRMRHGLRGSLAGLTVTPGGVEPPRVLACLTRCLEQLDTPAMELLQPSMELLTNNEMTHITIEGDNVTNLETLLRRVAYTNARDAPTPGRRPLTITTTILCASGGGLRIPPVTSQVVVLPPHLPGLLIAGTRNFAREYQSFRAGLRIFPDVGVTVPQGDQPEGSGEGAGEVTQCTVGVYPPLNPDHETLLLPDNLIRDLGLTSAVSRQGTTITGPNTAQRYTTVLRQLHYGNRKPAYYLNRAFKLSCWGGTGAPAPSNEYLQTVTVIHPQLNMETPPQSTAIEDDTLDLLGHQATLEDGAAAGEDNATADGGPQTPPHTGARLRVAPPRSSHARVSPHVVGEGGHTVTDLRAPAAGHPVTIIVVVCVGFLVGVGVLVGVRLRATRARRGVATPNPLADPHVGDAEMAWDDTALNITCNPMEMELCEGGRLHGSAAAAAAGEEHTDDSSDEDDVSHYGSSSDEEDEVDEEVEDQVEVDDSAARSKQLEWDDKM